ncbi:aminotransferase class I/II-fold pyridoxal phosphate-dependent enzyme [Paenisporosarcina quisquiliarum]|uniref:Aminotransferase class I/II-fold pyridoxal phosphate-dependent enzyme n=1 Tax=Paenisporosarcina quisquiliarum TaxID=365346 RepID=A0A9X3LI67_9BACL|nr:aminotransferase class I/II-fold pyridoxal phosphate-dependent enzyme [Paenisporosarcina quisquiliarum]MCZ8538477.1 aminotransferase class I/II-fold pyridoxal phosphate-dependent enzyme [Paenisporosarcina quisquiliarum]
MNERPIVEAMKRFYENQNSSFHVPGHKHGALSELPRAFKDVMKFDYTELSGLDDYHHPEEVIEEAQALLAKTYAAQHSYFLVNGSTVGNLAMVYATCGEGDRVLVQRNAHKSVFHALELVGAQPVFLTPQWDEETYTPSHVSLTTVSAAIDYYPDAKALILTHPTYYGVTNPEMVETIRLAQAHGIPVLVDEAHGAHFIGEGEFPMSALEMGADVVVQSAHKTLPALTMGSFLHINSSRVSKDKVNRYLRMLQSSSPSYLILASLDDARHFIGTYAHEDQQLFIKTRRQFVDSLKTISSLEVIEADDPLKLILRVPHHTGFTLQKQLEHQGIYVELADPEQVLMILPLLKARHHFPFAEIRKKIKAAVEKCFNQQRDKVEIDYSHEIEALSTLAVPYKELQALDSEWIPFTKANGRICAGMVIPYPPGIPLFVRGEKITTNKLKMLADYLASGATIQGEHDLSRKLLLVLKEEKV